MEGDPDQLPPAPRPDSMLRAVRGLTVAVSELRQLAKER